ncbi:hypothetical protein IL306_013854 [Fusarium sp. DS 682]|nr:hypothetical protein IL306_013854 [Fusarium sp. DS 682]
MDGSQHEAPIQAMPDNSKKRAASRSPSILSSQAKRLKKICYEDDNQDMNEHIIYEPTPIRTALPSYALFEHIKATQTPLSLLEQIDTWLDTLYPLQLQTKSRSDCFIKDQDCKPILPKRPNSAPTIMSGRTKLTGQAANLGLSPTPNASLGALIPALGTEEGYSVSPTPTETPSKFSGPLVESPLYRDCNLALNNISLLDSRTKLPDHLSSLVETLKKGRSSPEPKPLENDDLYLMESGASEAKVEDFFRKNVIPPASDTDTIQRSDRIFVSKSALPLTPKHLKLSIPVPDILYGYRFSALETDHRTEITASGNFAFANNEGLVCPFFAIEFKGDGPSSKGSL